jgi:hypothetical protein
MILVLRLLILVLECVRESERITARLSEVVVGDGIHSE